MENTKIYKSLHNPYKVVQMFEQDVAAYTGAKYAIAVDSCTDALFLCCRYKDVEFVEIPSKTYLSVPQAIVQAGGQVLFNAYRNDWQGMYELKPYSIYDAAKRFTSGMYMPNTLMCLSFHIKKHLNIGKGGMILTDDVEAVQWFKKARYEGRGEQLYHTDDLNSMGWNMYMTPEQAVRGLMLMQNIPLVNDDLIEQGGYKDLTEYTLFKNASKI